MEGPRSVTPIRVLIADDHRLFAEALEAVTLAAELQPDVVLMDVRLPVLDGIEATRATRAERPDACILMLPPRAPGPTSTGPAGRAPRGM
jgi:DNA-binding NarL/FixJ family response regulator